MPISHDTPSYPLSSFYTVFRFLTGALCSLEAMCVILLLSENGSNDVYYLTNFDKLN